MARGRVFMVLPSVIILTLLTVGVLSYSIPVMYAGIIAICATVVLVAFGILGKKQYPYLLFAIALGMTFQLTLAGLYLVGADVHLEYYWAQFYAGEDVWYPLRDYCPGAGLGAILFAPMLQKVFYIPNLWTFKVIFPICFAFVPVVLFHLFNRWIDEKKSFIATFMFIAFPCFLLEMPGIPESMLAELFMVLAIYLIIVDKFRLRYRIPLIIVCGLLAGFTHYSMGFITIAFLGVAFFTRIALRIRNGIPHKAMAGILLTVCIGTLVFFSFIASGAVMIKVSGIWNSWVPGDLKITAWHYPQVNEQSPQPLPSPAPLPSLTTSSFIPQSGDAVPIPDITGEEADASASEIVEMVIESPTERTIINASTGEVIRVESKIKEVKPWFSRYHNLMQTALGMDFGNASIAGKVFRIYLWLTGLLILIGLFVLRKNKEYWIFATGAIILAGVCLYPRISPILNASRFAHFALLFLVPAFVAGGHRVFRHMGGLAICLLVPYFLITSGFVFEVAKYDSPSSVDIPYSYGLSGQRIDLGVSLTGNDMEVIKWIATHKEAGDDVVFPIFADLAGTSVLNEVMGYRPDLIRAFYKHAHLMPKPPWYAFIRERNIEDGGVIIYKGIGQRDHYPFELFKSRDEGGAMISASMDVNKNILYQVGDARVIYVGGEE